MANNPLQQYFRQPKIFISLPSQGIYNKPGSISGDVARLPIFGMTGMDEILMKTPDALLAGESTAKVINSCCPSINDPWDLSSLDTDIMLTAIRIATYGGIINISNECSNCKTPSEYELELSKLIDHYTSCKYDNKLVLDELTVILKPLCYKQTTDFSIRNFQLQQQLTQISSIENTDERAAEMNRIYQQLATLRNDVFAENIESVDTGKVVVVERAFIVEWLNNVDRSVIAAITAHIESNQKTWQAPAHKVKCDNCGHEDALAIDLDQSNFFVNA
jgi:hypothetical protein